MRRAWKVLGSFTSGYGSFLKILQTHQELSDVGAKFRA